jgi:hypothetical protein
MDMIVCNVAINAKTMPSGFEERLCATAVDAIKGRSVTSDDMKSALSSGAPENSDDRFHVIDATILSPHAIAYAYSFGTAEQWNNRRETVIKDLRIDISDAELNDAALTLLANTVRRLSQ